MSYRQWAACLLAMGLLVTTHARAQGTEGVSEQARQFVEQLHFKAGDVQVSDANATIHVNPSFSYLDREDARKVLEQLWGNPPDETVLGLIVPKSPGLLDAASWAVVVTYQDDGYVSDEEAGKINYDELLSELKSNAADSNAERKRQGYPTVDLVGWAEPPRYDQATAKMYWAKEVAFDDSGDHTLNYEVRVLGRRGVLSLEAVSGMNELTQVREGMQTVLGMTEFNAGARYADFNSTTDKVAGYGLAALVGGVAASKLGLFAKLGLVLAKFWKLALVGVAALGAGLKKMFTKGERKTT